MSLVDILILVATVPAILFPFVYGFTAKWWRTVLGRALMYSGVSIAMLFTLFSLNVLFDSYYGHSVVRVVTLILVLSMTWVKLLSYLITVYEVKRRQHEELYTYVH